MNPGILLTVLETAGIVRTVQSVPEAEYTFRHGLMHETVYSALLRQERQDLHLAVGEAIVNSFPERGEELSPLLGDHFLRGGDEARALDYFALAGRQARDRYANAEALEYYRTAVDLARKLGRSAEEANLLRELGLTHEIVGDLEAARQDHKQVLTLGRKLEDLEIEWRALLDLGKVWAAQDYSKAGEHFRAALDVARRTEKQEAIARSLNRLGNWHINQGETEESKRYHEEALGIFEQLDHEQGIAETLDFLGMTNMISSDVRKGTQYYDRAIPLLRSIGDKQRLASAMTARALRGGQAQSETVIGLGVPIDQMAQELDEALAATRELGWKSGESFALWMKAFVQSAGGRFDQALRAASAAHELASEIGHVQWTAAACCALGRVHMEMLDDEQARRHLERAVGLAQETGSRHWGGVTAGTLGLLCAQQGAIAPGEQVVAEFMNPEPGMVMLGDRLAWLARAELLLKQLQFGPAKEILDELLSRAPGYSDDQIVPRISRDLGLIALGTERWEEARLWLEPALSLSNELGAYSLAWKLHGDLARALLGLGEPERADEQLESGRQRVQKLAENIPDERLRRLFQQRAEGFLSLSPTEGAALYP